MSKEKLKKELHELIDNMENEQLLNMVKEDIVAYQKTETDFDDLSDLTHAERAELEELANEDPDKDVVSEEEFYNYKKRFINKLDKVLLYLEKEWGQKCANVFIDKLLEKITLIKKQPEIGSITVYKNIRSVLITKQNKIYYRIEKDRVEIINMIDTRRNPEKNPFNKNK